MSKRNPPPTPTLGRRGPSRPAKIALLIYSEGKNTEPTYLRGFAHAFGNNLVRIKIEAAAGVPMTLVQSALGAKAAITKTRNSFEKFDQVWTVFDRDEHPNFEEALELARANGINVAMSNPCFEVWLLLHMGDYDAPDNRHEAQKKYASADSSYNPNGSKEIDFEKLLKGYDKACGRAKRMRTRREEERNHKGAPYTDVDNLTELIRENGR